ncbi:MAG: glycosyltransferase [Thiotrichaceae bacterium]|nr:glycosyltransferase [Thiotrichaceae bacterium]
MRKSSIAILAFVLVSNFVIWAMFNLPESAQVWTGTIRGVSFSPYQAEQSPFEQKFPSPQDIEHDLQFLQDKVTSVRTYSSMDGIEIVPQLAGHYDLHVTAGAWIDHRLERNEIEIRNLIKNAQKYRNIDRVIVGNESILRGDFTVKQLIEYIRRVRALTQVPVSTAEPWHVWIEHPELAQEVDFIAVHLLPYWEKVANEEAVPWVFEHYNKIKTAYPNKHVLVGEVGWPSNGNRFGRASATLAGQAKFMRQFLNRAATERLDYFIMEAFDQPWKKAIEGSVGRHWGIFDANRHEKFSMTEDITENPYWSAQAIVAMVLSVLPMLFFLFYWQNVRLRGQLFFAVLLQLAASLMTWTLFMPATVELGTLGNVVWGVLLPAQLALVFVVVMNAFELTEMVWSRYLRRDFKPLKPNSNYAPKVSLHLAICNEPPEMVKLTLDSLAKLDYPNFEVLVLDNNTVDPEIWKPVEAHCKLLGEKFRFFHLGKWKGYKAGALNFGLTQTAPDAEVIGVIDSDYLVESDWLSTLVPYFENQKVGFVQAPQDNREWEGDLFKTMCNWEYAGFFNIGMVQRNERDAIIQHGTMTLIRRSALNEVGDWGEWCICEDAELGMRLMRAGYNSVYVNHAYGKGLTPDSFAGYKRQRFRWVYGAVQIMRKRWRWLLTEKTGLTLGQRVHFIAGWFPWFTDAMHLTFTFAGIFWSIAMVLFPETFEFPLAVFLVPTLGVFAFKIIHALALYKVRVKCSFWQRIGAAIAGMGLTHAIARAIWLGLTTTQLPFMRTPKCENKPAILVGFYMVWEEVRIMLLLWFAALSVLLRFGTTEWESNVWVTILLVQSVPYAAALFTSLANVVTAEQVQTWAKPLLQVNKSLKDLLNPQSPVRTSRSH